MFSCDIGVYYFDRFWSILDKTVLSVNKVWYVHEKYIYKYEKLNCIENKVENVGS